MRKRTASPYYVDTVGKNTSRIAEYIQNQLICYQRVSLNDVLQEEEQLLIGTAIYF